MDNINRFAKIFSNVIYKNQQFSKNNFRFELIKEIDRTNFNPGDNIEIQTLTQLIKTGEKLAVINGSDP